jgi:hypothetical protein
MLGLFSTFWRLGVICETFVLFCYRPVADLNGGHGGPCHILKTASDYWQTQTIAFSFPTSPLLGSSNPRKSKLHALSDSRIAGLIVGKSCRHCIMYFFYRIIVIYYICSIGCNSRVVFSQTLFNIRTELSMSLVCIKGVFSSLQNSKFLHSLSITSIFRRMYGALNVGKRNN